MRALACDLLSMVRMCLPNIRGSLIAIALASAGLFPGRANGAEPIRPKILILTTFEIGADTGDRPGELQYWVEREHLNGTLDVAGLIHPVRYNDAGVYAMVTGTCNRSGLAMMLLGMDPDFDLRKTYFMMAGIAGVDADRASVGSAAWAQWIVDGDNVNEIDDHDVPQDWPYGILPYGASRPDEVPGKGDWSQKPMAFQLNPGLVAWAYRLSKDVALSSTPELDAYRAKYVGFPNAQRPPFVLLGDTLGTARYGHGPVLTKWAERWCEIYTGGKARFVMTECEDQSIAYALMQLGRAHRVDPSRYLVLRTASNYSQPPPGVDLLHNLHSGEASGTTLAAESAYRVGSPIVHSLVQHWDLYESSLPTEDSP
jgi:purine nucleoside permease